MAFKKGGHQRPQYSISTSVFVRKGKYLKGPSFGLWLAESGPMARGSVKEDYLQELVEFLEKAQSKDQSVSFALFKNKPKKDRDEDDDDDDEDEDEDEDGDEDEDEDEKEEKKSKKRKAEKPEKSSGKSKDKAGKKGAKKDWDFDEDDED